MSRVANFDFFVMFLHESTHLANCEINLQISKIFIFCKLGFFCISPRIGAFGNFWDYFANLSSADFLNISRQIDTFDNCWDYFANFQYFFLEKFFYFDFDEICAKITVQISFIRFCSFGRSKLLQTWIFCIICDISAVSPRMNI